MPTKRILDNSLNPILGLNLKPVANAKVIFNLVDVNGRTTDVWTNGARIAGMLEAATDANGVFWDYATGLPLPVELWANDEGYTPTRYSCRVIASGVIIHDFIGSVSAFATPLSWAEFMANGESLIAAGLGTLYVQHSLANADDDFLLASAGRWVKRTLAEAASKLGITAHVSNLNNPHQVNKAQMGLSNVDNTSDLNKPISTLAQAALDAKADSIGGYVELTGFDINFKNTTGTVISLLSNSATVARSFFFPDKNGTVAMVSDVSAAQTAAKNYADGLVVGLWDDRGNFNASFNTFPSTGGSGGGGSVKKGNIWTVSVAGTLGGMSVGVGDTVRALIDAPTVNADWAVGENNIGYVPENTASKTADISANSTSNIFYTSAKAVFDYVAVHAAAFVTLPHTWSKPQTGAMVAGAASSANNTAVDFALGNNIDFGTLTENTLLGAPTGGVSGQYVTMYFKQDLVTPYAVTFHSNFVFTTPAPPTAPATLGVRFELVGMVLLDGTFRCSMVVANGAS